MIWLTWRQYRVQTLVALAALAAITAYLMITGTQMRDTYDTNVASCQGDCAAAKDTFISEYQTLSSYVTSLLIAVPGIIGVFWGAPLIARELEAGTHRLVWNQSITRTRWIAVKLTAIGLVAVATTGLLTLLVTWWSGPLDRINQDRFTPPVFDARGVVPLSYTAFAFVLGACAGLLIRRTVPAMAAALAVFVAVQVVVPFAIRPHLMSPDRTDVALSSLATSPDNAKGGTGTPTADWSATQIQLSGSGADAHLGVGLTRPGDWVVSGVSPVLDSAGRAATGSEGCAKPEISPLDCFGTSDLHVEVAYQPADRYWTFQWMETAVFLALAGLLTGFCVWWLRRRLA